jgi:hypothetical protein
MHSYSPFFIVIFSVLVGLALSATNSSLQPKCLNLRIHLEEPHDRNKGFDKLCAEAWLKKPDLNPGLYLMRCNNHNLGEIWVSEDGSRRADLHSGDSILKSRNSTGFQPRV